MENQNIPVSVRNKRLIEQLERGDIKSAQDAAQDCTRLQVREDSFAFKILPPEKADDSMLDRAIDERLQIIWENEPDTSAVAKWVPLQTVPEGEYISGSRYIIPFARVITPKFQKDLDELRTYRQDLRRLFSDMSIKDALTVIDQKFIGVVNTHCVLGGVAGDPNPITNKVQWAEYSDQLNRETFADATKLLPTPRVNGDGKLVLRNYVALMNDITARDLLKLTRDEVGGDLSQDMFKNGLTTDTIMGVKCIFTIKAQLVPTNTIYFFAEPGFLGKSFYLTDWTMFMEKKAFFIEWFSHWLGGFAFGNMAGMARVDFNVKPATP